MQNLSHVPITCKWILHEIARVDRPVGVCSDLNQSTPIVQILELPCDYFVSDTEYVFGFIKCYFLFFYSFAAIGLHLFTIVMGDAERVSSGPPTMEEFLAFRQEMAEFRDTARFKEMALQKTTEANLIQSGTSNPVDATAPSAKKKKIGEVDVDDFLESDGHDGDAEMKPEQEEDELLDELLSSYGEEDDVSEDVGVKLAILVNKMFEDPLSLDACKEKQKLPKNCEKVQTPKVNDEIWGKLSKVQKLSDIRTASVQTTVV